MKVIKENIDNFEGAGKLDTVIDPVTAEAIDQDKKSREAREKISKDMKAKIDGAPKAQKPKKIEESLYEDTNVRQTTDEILELIEDGMLDAYDVALACLKYMSEDEVSDMARLNDLLVNDEIDEALCEDTEVMSPEEVAGLVGNFYNGWCGLDWDAYDEVMIMLLQAENKKYNEDDYFENQNNYDIYDIIEKNLSNHNTRFAKTLLFNLNELLKEYTTPNSDDVDEDVIDDLSTIVKALKPYTKKSLNKLTEDTMTSDKATAQELADALGFNFEEI